MKFLGIVAVIFVADSLGVSSRAAFQFGKVGSSKAALSDAAASLPQAARVFDGAAANLPAPVAGSTASEPIGPSRTPADATPPTPRAEIATKWIVPSVIDQAEALARQALEKNTFDVVLPETPEKRTIVTAGSHNYKSLWTRDACFALMGLLGDARGQKIAKDTLQTLFDRTNAEGQFPRRQGDYPHLPLLSTAMWSLGIPIPDPRALSHFEYSNPSGAPQIDATALPLILAGEYVKSTGDLDFLRRNAEAMNHASAWLESLVASGGGLIDQPGGADWKDVIHRSGKVTYTNVVAFKAFEAMAEMSRAGGDAASVQRFQDAAERLKTAINGQLWDADRGYYKDSDGIAAFSPDGNMLAILWGVADHERSGKILDRLQDSLREDGLPFPALIGGHYPDDRIPWWLKFAGIARYHDAFAWPWQGNIGAIAAARAGRLDLAREILGKVAAQAVKDGTFYEIYDPSGEPKPARSLFYRSEPDFLWSAGTFLWASREIEAARRP